MLWLVLSAGVQLGEVGAGGATTWGGEPGDAVTLSAATCRQPEAPCTDVCTSVMSPPTEDCYLASAALSAEAAEAACGCAKEATSDRTVRKADAGLCDHFLYVAYAGAAEAREDRAAESLWRLDPGEWQRRALVAKRSREGGEFCTRTYTAVCAASAIEVRKTCVRREPGDARPALTAAPLEAGKDGWVAGACPPGSVGSECVELRPLQLSWRRPFYRSRGTDFDPGRFDSSGEYAIDVYDPDWQRLKLYDRGTGKWHLPDAEFGTLTRATRVSWEVAASLDGQATLSPIPLAPGQRQGWKVPTGCYCCKHSYNFVTNPFGRIYADRQAWNTANTKWESDAAGHFTPSGGGTQECMLAWSDLPDGLATLLPRALLMIADYSTLTIGSHAACAATCASASGEFMMHKHSYRKLQEQAD